MTQFLNNIWIALSSENPELLQILLVPFGIIENYLFMSLFLSLFKMTASIKQKVLYVLSIFTASTFTLYLIPSPFNVFINYALMIILIHFIFKFNFLNSFISLVLPTFTFGILNSLLQGPYLALLNITPTVYMTTPIYRIPCLTILYIFVFIICIIVRNFKNIKLSLNFLESLDKRTILLLCANLLIGFITLCVQLTNTAFYIGIVPTIISILNCILLISFLILSIYSFTRIIKLANTRKNLESAEEYNKSLEILYDKVKGFKHDFDNIVSTLDGFIENKDMDGLKNYFNEVKKDCKITNNLSILNPRIINNPGIYSLLNNKYFKATNLGITFDIEYFLDLNKIDINLYEFSRILGILIDNAIEEAEKCKNKIIKITFIKENRNNRSVITVQNTYSNKNINIESIFAKGVSGKENHSGIGLWEVKNYIKKSKNLDLYTSKNDKFFKQELSIYDLQKR